MAFVSRAERRLVYGPATTSSLGPGAYIGHNQYKAKHGSAPFSSTAEREAYNVN